MAKKFEWVDFYKEFAGKLLEYKNKRNELVEKVKKIFEMSNINFPKLERDNNIIDIDPFTVFGFFNKKESVTPNLSPILNLMVKLESYTNLISELYVIRQP